MPGNSVPLNTITAPVLKGMSPPPHAQNEKLNAAARDFEAVYLTEMIRPMLDTVDVDEVFGGGKGEEVFRGMLADEYGKIMARSGGIGLATHVREAMIKAQEAANGAR